MMGKIYPELARNSSKHFLDFQSILITTLWGRYSEYSHFTGEQTEVR